MNEENKTAEATAEVAQTATTNDNYFANLDLSKLEITLEGMLKGGVHFGHRKSRKHPKMSEFVYTTRKGINIIDLQKTLEKLEEALQFVAKLKAEGKTLILVSTKKQTKDIIRSAAEVCNLPYVVERWLGGTFTNFKVIRDRAKYLKEGEEMLEKGEFKKYTKFEQMKKAEEIEKLEKKMGGIKNMNELPGAVFAVDIKEDALAIREAHRMGIPVIALADTNNDPTQVEYPIPANDDAISSIRLILSYICKILKEDNK
jgi:small subunit ribosomal protein S2